jgi:hypothetical protein
VGQGRGGGNGSIAMHLPALSLLRLSGVNKSNAVVDRARLDHFNGCHIKRLVATSLPTAGGGGGGGGGGGDAWAPPRRKDGELPLALPDTPQLARLRDAVMPAVAARLSQLAPAGVPGMAADVSVERVNSLLLAQVERVHVVSEYVPLLAPFLVSRGAFPAWMASQGGNTAAVGRLVKAASKGARAAAGAAAPHDPATTAAASELAGAAALAAGLQGVLSRAAPVIATVAAAWESMDDVAFLAGAGTCSRRRGGEPPPPPLAPHPTNLLNSPAGRPRRQCASCATAVLAARRSRGRGIDRRHGEICDLRIDHSSA